MRSCKHMRNIPLCAPFRPDTRIKFCVATGDSLVCSHAKDHTHQISVWHLRVSLALRLRRQSQHPYILPNNDSQRDIFCARAGRAKPNVDANDATQDNGARARRSILYTTAFFGNARCLCVFPMFPMFPMRACTTRFK